MPITDKAQLQPEPRPERRFAEGDEVTIVASGQKARVIFYLTVNDGRQRVLVDYPHGAGFMRQTLDEKEIQ